MEKKKEDDKAKKAKAKDAKDTKGKDKKATSKKQSDGWQKYHFVCLSWFVSFNFVKGLFLIKTGCNLFTACFVLDNM